MYFIQYFHYITLIYYFHQLQLCSTQKSRALVITKENDEFKLTIPDSYDPNTKESKFTAPKNGKIHLFCQADYGINLRVYLKAVEKNFGNKFNDLNKCHKSALPVFVKVNNPQDLKNTVWDTMNMELYHSGYKLSTNIPGEKKINHDTSRKPEYDDWKSSDYELLVEIEAYYDKTLKQVVATEYTLLSTNLPFHEQLVNKDYIAMHGRNELHVPDIMVFANRPEYSYLEMFTKKLSEHWMKILNDARKSDNYLSITLFASNLHFPIPLWERQTLQTFNTFPMFLKPKKMWQKVQKFSRIVAKHFGDLKVKTGITDIMTLSGTEFVDTEGFRFPKYLWNAYEYHDRNEAHGIIVVLNYNPFEETDVKICETKNTCNDNGWIIGNDDFREGEIYCCGMTRDNIHKLKVDFMALTEKPIFNLRKWEDKMGQIKTEFVELLNQEIEKKQENIVKLF